MSDELTQSIVIKGNDEASAVVLSIIKELEKLKTLQDSINKSFAKPAGLNGLTDAAKAMKGMADNVKRAADEMARMARIASQMKSPDMAGANRSRPGGRDAISSMAKERRAFTSAMRGVSSELRRMRADNSPSDRISHQDRATKSSRSSRRTVGGSFHEAGSRMGRADDRISHPFFSSPAFAAMTALTASIYALKTSIDAAVTIDTAATKIRMFGGLSPAEASKARAQALRDSVTYGTGAEHLLNIQSEAMRAGVPKDIATAMSSMIPKAAAARGATAERVADSMGEALQQLVASGVVTGPESARRFINDVAGLSNFGGNTTEKMQEFLAAGGIGRGRELGLNTADTMGMAAMLNSMGARTGQYAARMFGQLSTIAPEMSDRWTKAARSRNQDADELAVLRAPRMLGYESAAAMAKSMTGSAEGFIKWVKQVAKLPEELQKRMLRGFGFAEGTGAVIAEIAASPEKAMSFITEARRLDTQKAGADYLSDKFKEWSTSLAFMLQQIEAGFEVIKAELGDAFKSDIIAPFRDAWVDFTKHLLDGGLRDRFHTDLMAFINGIGFKDAAEMLAKLRLSIGNFDAPAFFRGVGEGFRAISDAARSLYQALGFLSGSTNAEAIGKLSAELFGFALAAHAIAPVIGIIASVTEIIVGLKAALQGTWAVVEFAGLVKGIKAVAALPFESATMGLTRLAGALGIFLGAIDQGIKSGILGLPQDKGIGDWLGRHLRGLLNPFALPDAGKIEHQSYKGGDIAGLIHKAAFIADDSLAGRAVRNTDRTVSELLENAKRSSTMIMASIPSGSAVMGVPGGGSDGSATAPGRFGNYRLPDSIPSLGGGSPRSTGIGSSRPSRRSGGGSFGPESIGMAPQGLFDAIAKAEGTTKDGYDTLLGYGHWGRPDKPISTMTLDEVKAFGLQERAAQVRAGMAWGRTSSANGKFQITGSTMMAAAKALGLDPATTVFNGDTQKRMASWIVKHQGLGAWEGFKVHPDLRAKAADFLRHGQFDSPTAIAHSMPNATSPGVHHGGPVTFNVTSHAADPEQVANAVRKHWDARMPYQYTDQH